MSLGQGESDRLVLTSLDPVARTMRTGAVDERHSKGGRGAHDSGWTSHNTNEAAHVLVYFLPVMSIRTVVVCCLFVNVSSLNFVCAALSAFDDTAIERNVDGRV